MQSIIAFSIKKETFILKLSSSLIIGSTEASFENSVLFCGMPWSLNLISICFAILQFSELEILNSLKNLNNSLICFIAMSMRPLLFCNGLLTKLSAWAVALLSGPEGGVNICAEAAVKGSRDRWQVTSHSISARSPKACRWCSCHICCHSGPRSLTAWPRAPRHPYCPGGDGPGLCEAPWSCTNVLSIIGSSGS